MAGGFARAATILHEKTRNVKNRQGRFPLLSGSGQDNSTYKAIVQTVSILEI